MTQFCLLLLRGVNSVASCRTVSFHMAICFAVVRGICVCYSQISLTTRSCPECYSHLCLGVGRSVFIWRRTECCQWFLIKMLLRDHEKEQMLSFLLL